MASDPGLYSRLVAILKVLLPLVALGLLSALFLVPTEDRPGQAVIFSRGDIAALGEGMRVVNPTFTGTTDDEDRFRFDALLVIPDAAPPTKASITSIEGRIEFVGGLDVDLIAASGELDIPEDMLELAGDVQIDTSDGYSLRTEQLSVDLDLGLIEAREAVEATGPVGRIDAGRMRISPADGTTDDTRRFLFGNGVRLIYDPPAKPE